MIFRQVFTLVIICVSLLMASTIFSQNRFSISISAGPEFSCMRIKNSNTKNFQTSITEKGGVGVGYNFSIKPQLMLDQNTFLRSGLMYKVSQYKSYMQNLLLSIDVQGEIIYKNTAQSIAIPIEIGRIHPLKNKSFTINYGVGFQYNYFIEKSTDSRMEQTDGHSYQVESFNTAVLAEISAYIFAGINKDLNKKLNLGIEPYIKYSPNKFTTAIYESKAKTLLETGISLRLTIN